MKRLPENYYERQLRIVRNRTRKKKSETIKSKDHSAKKSASTKPTLIIMAPIEIGLHNQTLHRLLVTFIKKIKKECIRHAGIIKIDFSETQKVYSTGMLLLLAELDRAMRATANKSRIVCNYPKDETVEKVFQQIGFLQILKKPHRLTITKEDKTVFNWRFASDVSVNQKSAGSLMQVIKDQIPVGYQRLVTGIGEAMDNAVHHAYIRPRGDRLSGCPSADERRWWVFAQVLDGKLHVVFCDLGLGIPVTLPEKWNEELYDILRLTRLSRGKRDSRMIRRSLELGRTRTEQSHRGKGLKRNILKAAQELGGRLNIYSNYGVVGADFSGGRSDYSLGTNDRSILGTVIQWSIPITD